MKKALSAILLICVFVCALTLTSCNFTDNNDDSNTGNFTEAYTPPDNADYIRNPDCGFYQPLSFSLKSDGIKYSLKGYLERNNLLHLRMNLSAFKESALTTEALNDLDKLLSELRENSVNAIIRFAYDGFNGYKDVEAPMNLILRHIEQIGSVIKNHSDVLTAVEVGMIGPWGEMHSSAIATKDNFNALIAAWLKNTDSTTPILARRPRMIADYLGINVKELGDRIAQKDTDEYRLGVFNDGYLGSANDLGTYVNRDIEVKWLSNQAAHTPFGGEVTIPGSEYNKINFAAYEMFLTHTSYLNEFWNDKVIAEWKNTIYDENAGTDVKYYGKTAYEYIRDHMGYRFTISDIALPIKPDKNIKMKFNITNDGFGNLLKNKTCELLFVGKDKTYISPINIDPMQWYTGNTYTIETTVNPILSSDNYTVYLRMRDPQQSDIPRYCVAFANGRYNFDIQANELGTISID